MVELKALLSKWQSFQSICLQFSYLGYLRISLASLWLVPGSHIQLASRIYFGWLAWRQLIR